MTYIENLNRLILDTAVCFQLGEAQSIDFLVQYQDEAETLYFLTEADL